MFQIPSKVQNLYLTLERHKNEHPARRYSRQSITFCFRTQNHHNRLISLSIETSIGY